MYALSHIIFFCFSNPVSISSMSIAITVQWFQALMDYCTTTYITQYMKGRCWTVSLCSEKCWELELYRYCFSIRKTSNLRHNFFHHAGWTFQLKILAEWHTRHLSTKWFLKQSPKCILLATPSQNTFNLNLSLIIYNTILVHSELVPPLT